MNEKPTIPIRIDVSKSQLAQIAKGANRAGKSVSGVRWLEDEFRPYRWYHARWDFFRVWWLDWRRGDQPFKGLLCVILFRHKAIDGKGTATLMDVWTPELLETRQVCLRCGVTLMVIRFLKNPPEPIPFRKVDLESDGTEGE